MAPRIATPRRWLAAGLGIAGCLPGGAALGQATAPHASLAGLPVSGETLVCLLVVALASLGWLAVWLFYRRRASKIASSNEGLRRGIDSLSEGFAIYDADDRLYTCNSSYRRFFGRMADEIQPGRAYTEILIRLLDEGMIDDARGREDAWFHDRLQRHRRPVQPFEMRLDGRWVEVREDRQPDGSTALILLDISARKEMEANLRESESRYRDLVEGSVQGFGVHRQERILLANQELARIFGYADPAAIMALPSVYDLVAEADRESQRERAQARLDGEEIPQQYAFRGQHKDGTIIWLFTSVRRVIWDGEPAIQFSVIDITDQKRTEEALQRSEERYRVVVEDQTELICRALPDGTVTFVNSAYCRFFGGRPEDWIGRRYLESMPAEERERETVHLRSLVRIPRTVSFERRSVNAAGETRWLEWTDRLLQRGEGAPAEIQSVGHDVTDRKAVEEALLQSEQRYRQVVDDQTDLIRRFHPDTTLTFVNEAYCRYFDRRREDLLGRSFLDFVSEEEREGLQDHLAKVGQSQEAVSREVRVTGPLGELRWQLWTEIAFRNARGRVVEFQSVGRDITARKIVEERFRAFIDNAPAAISIKDRNGRYLVVNRRFAELANLDLHEIVGETSEALFPRAFVRSGREHDEEVLFSGHASAREETLVTAQGQIHLLTVKFPLLDDPGEVGLVAAIHTDISRLKQVEAQLEVAKEEAETASAAKTRFLAAASHDLRQPLHAMRLLIDTLRMSGGVERQSQIIDQIGNAASSMSLLLNALLDIGELESGAVKPKVADFRIGPVIENVIATVSPSAAQKGLTLRAVPSSLVVRSDPVLLARIFDNLLSNAVRYTDSGGVLVGCRRQADSLRIEVWDSGRGIPEDSLEAVFEDYRQLGNVGRDRSQGLGLGLGIVQRLARLLGLEVVVQSWPERGSVFSVEVPLGALENLAEEQEAVDPVTLRAGPSSVMIVEDDPMVAEAAALMLRTWGITVHQASNAQEAMERFRGLTVLPEVVIADYRLPDGENGLFVIQRIRQRYDPSMPAIVVTGDISPKILMEAEAKGCEVLRKPVEPGKLRALLRACAADAGHGKSHASAEPPHAAQ